MTPIKPSETLTYKNESFYYVGTIQNTIKAKDRVMKDHAGKKVALVHTHEGTAYVYVSKLRYADKINTMYPINITNGGE